MAYNLCLLVSNSLVFEGSSISAADRKETVLLALRKASAVLGCPSDCVEELAERRTITNHSSYPLLDALGSSFTDRLFHQVCRRVSPSDK